MKRHIKSILIAVACGILFWMLAGDAFAAIQLDDNLRPGNLPEAEVVDATDPDNPETAATQTLILFVGNLISQVLLFVGAIVVLFLIVAGSNYILAFGKDERIEKGKRGMLWAVIGLFTILLSYAIVQGAIAILLQVG